MLVAVQWCTPYQHKNIKVTSRFPCCNFAVFVLVCWSPSIDAHHINIKTSTLHHTFREWCKFDGCMLICCATRLGTSRFPCCNFDVFMLVCWSPIIDAQHISIKKSKLHHAVREWCKFDVLMLVRCTPSPVRQHISTKQHQRCITVSVSGSSRKMWCNADVFMLTYLYNDIIVVGVVAAVAVVDITVTASSGQVLWHQGCPYQQASARPTGTWFVLLFFVCVFLCCSLCVIYVCFDFVFVFVCSWFVFGLLCWLYVLLLCCCLLFVFSRLFIVC